MKRVTAILAAGCVMACLLGGCTHTHRLDGVEVGKPEKPAVAAPLKLPLNEQEVIQAAVREAERRRIPLQEFEGPDVRRTVNEKDQWCVFYWRGRFPGDHFMFVVNARTGETRYVPGE